MYGTADPSMTGVSTSVQGVGPGAEGRYVAGITFDLLKFQLRQPESHFLANRRRRVSMADLEFREGMPTVCLQD